MGKPDRQPAGALPRRDQGRRRGGAATARRPRREVSGRPSTNRGAGKRVRGERILLARARQPPDHRALPERQEHDALDADEFGPGRVVPEPVRRRVVDLEQRRERDAHRDVLEHEDPEPRPIRPRRHARVGARHLEGVVRHREERLQQHELHDRQDALSDERPRRRFLPAAGRRAERARQRVLARVVVRRQLGDDDRVLCRRGRRRVAPVPVAVRLGRAQDRDQERHEDPDRVGLVAVADHREERRVLGEHEAEPAAEAVDRRHPEQRQDLPLDLGPRERARVRDGAGRRDDAAQQRKRPGDPVVDQVPLVVQRDARLLLVRAERVLDAVDALLRARVRLGRRAVRVRAAALLRRALVRLERRDVLLLARFVRGQALVDRFSRGLERRP
mmetsp:Transcript_32/g.106  ORF Transcript_32/g.106 Transcript_32/m.106 type:complete len:389 (-) Transcript_32:200-1366(-)